MSNSNDPIELRMMDSANAFWRANKDFLEKKRTLEDAGARGMVTVIQAEQQGASAADKSALRAEQSVYMILQHRLNLAREIVALSGMYFSGIKQVAESPFDVLALQEMLEPQLLRGLAAAFNPDNREEFHAVAEAHAKEALGQFFDAMAKRAPDIAKEYDTNEQVLKKLYADSFETMIKFLPEEFVKHHITVQIALNAKAAGFDVGGVPANVVSESSKTQTIHGPGGKLVN